MGVALGAAVASADIGPAGGRVDAPDGSLSVIVPAGAFDRVHTVALTPIANHAHGHLGAAWRITPEGLDTPVPMTVEWRYDEADARGAARLNIAHQGADRVWRHPRNVVHDTTTRTLRVQTRHFSDWSMVAGLQLRPGQAEVTVGKSLDLEVRDCGSGPDPADPVTDQRYACRADGASGIAVSHWAVNGVVGGNAAAGTLSALATGDFIARRTYTAPAAVPGSNPVAVSVRYVDPFTGQEQTLVSNLTVIDPTAGCTWLTGVQKMSAEFGVDYSWSGADTMASQTQRTLIDVRGVLQRVPVDVVGMVQFQGAMTEGRVQVDIETIQGTDRTTVKGDGPPLTAPELGTSVAVWVRLSDCAVFAYANAYVASVATRFSPQGTFELEGKSSAFGFRHDYRPIAGRREFIGDELLPALGTASLMDAFVPEAGYHDIDLPTMGQARVRWAFRPL